MPIAAGQEDSYYPSYPHPSLVLFRAEIAVLLNDCPEI